MKTNAKGVALIKRHEGMRLNAYRCPAGVWTIGYGHTGDVREGQRITEHQAEAILSVDLDRFERGVEFALPGVVALMTENQFSACVSLTFNIGVEAFTQSTLRKKLLAQDWDAAATEFAKWVHAKGVKLPGLVKRRAEEAALFLEPA
ncbi:hypothetical protein MYSTI_01912 [Myxococcus stipitatus DSM 14675]|uniref:Lysozyme n=1 Tax=Myxococcus stipitatus (strain DSM 14675 / JCM 12634 / Mx s8) TaxID=1278073 RepID=L7U523_MYXSD|nr:lysozyme [Myxococcus stipitatus]AGC43243.1 hypothetical protein MYSTI_01912 [Myxococcus stipitatus DSM 14675]